MKYSTANRPFNPWKRDRHPVLAGTTQRIFKTEILGCCRVRARGEMRFNKHTRLNKILQFLRRNQPYSPFEPGGETATFHGAVSQAMRNIGLVPDRLKIFTAVGSQLEKRLGYDGFFTFEGIMITVACDLYADAFEPHSRARVIVTGEDATNNYTLSAATIAAVLKDARDRGLKGVV